MEIAKGADYQLTLEHGEDVNSATVRNAQQYERQVMWSLLEKCDVLISKITLSYNEEVLKVNVREKRRGDG